VGIPRSLCAALHYYLFTWPIPLREVYKMRPSFTPQLFIGTIFVGVFALALYFVFSETLVWTETQESIALYLLGILSAALLEIIHFFFSSSAGSKEKTTIMGAKE
jgi:hypothetical protein